MNAELLLQYFDHISDAADAIPRLRQFVLELAIRGKLVDRNMSDEPATAVLERIHRKREELVKNKVVKLARAPYPPIAVGDDFELPLGWVRCTIGDACDLQTGATPDRTRSEYFGGSIPWLVSGDINRGEIRECDGRITRLGRDNSNCKILPADSVMIALNGQGKTRATVALLRIPAACNQSLVAIIPFLRDCLLPEYLYWNLRSRYQSIRRLTGQDDRRGLNMKLISCFELSIPPVKEQFRIVAKVSELMTLCDRLESARRERDSRRDYLTAACHFHLNSGGNSEARREQAKFYLNNLSTFTITSQQISRLRQTILDLAVHGHLLGRTDESVEEWNQREAISSDPSFPVRWSMLPLTKIAAEIVDCPHSTPKWTTEGKICVRTNQFRPGKLELSGVRFVSEATYKERIQRMEPAENDILYSREGGILGVACRVPPNTQLCLGQRMMLIRPGTRIDAAFLEIVLNSPLITRIALEKTTGGAAPRINVATVKAYPIPLPSLAEQHRIVAKVDELMAVCDALEKQLSATRTQCQNLLEAVLNHALNDTFEGASPRRPQTDLLPSRIPSFQ